MLQSKGTHDYITLRREVISMGYDHATVDYTTKQDRKEKVLQLMQKGDWKGVIQEFEVIYMVYRIIQCFL